MRFVIKHEIKGRLRVHILQSRMSFAQADTLQYYLDGQNNIVSAKIQERTLDVTVVYTGSREEALKTLENFTYQGTEVPENYLANSGREMNREYKDQLINKVVMHYGIRLFLPMDIRSVITTVKSFKYLWHGIKTLAKGKIEVPVLDATAIGVSVLRGDYNTAASVMFLLGIGEILEEWTHKKSVGDLARSMSLNIDKVWVVSDGQEILVPSTSIKSGDLVRIHMGNVIPFDGTVTDGEGMVNQASLTGESVAVRKNEGAGVFAHAQRLQYLCIPFRAGRQVRAAVWLYKIQCIVILQQRLHHRVALACPEPQPGGYLVVVLKAHKTGQFQQLVQRAHQLHVRVQIDAAVLVQHRQPRIVRYKGVFLCLVGLLCVAVCADLKILLVPLDDLVIRAVFLPAFHTFPVLRADSPAAEPAVMNDFRDTHTQYLICCSANGRCFSPHGVPLHLSQQVYYPIQNTQRQALLRKRPCAAHILCGILGCVKGFSNASRKFHRIFQFFD